jgi:hypothetical protein
MSFFLQNTPFAKALESNFNEVGATPILLRLRSTILGPPTQSLHYPSVTEQLVYLTFMKSDGEFLQAQEGVVAPKPEEGWRTIGGHEIWFYSKGQANFARYLELGVEKRFVISWRYRPHTFKLKGIKSEYTPDFRVVRDDVVWVQIGLGSPVKAWWFTHEHPDKELLQVDSDFSEDARLALEKAGFCIEDWEC